MFKRERKRVVITLVLIVIYCICFVLFMNHNKSQEKPIKITVYEIYTVMPGDTIWSVAEMYKHDDIRQLVYEIKKANNATSIIQAGQELKVPIQVKGR